MVERIKITPTKLESYSPSGAVEFSSDNKYLRATDQLTATSARMGGAIRAPWVQGDPNYNFGWYGPADNASHVGPIMAVTTKTSEYITPGQAWTLEWLTPDASFGGTAAIHVSLDTTTTLTVNSTSTAIVTVTSTYAPGQVPPGRAVSRLRPLRKITLSRVMGGTGNFIVFNNLPAAFLNFGMVNKISVPSTWASTMSTGVGTAAIPIAAPIYSYAAAAQPLAEVTP